ncbi:carboxylic acid reductase [Pseudofrankia inefficax]|uniref:Carboxylic acid reductase n=1 Tax=Pseudofrankia inefficax (strain DSM 45817 / CECT 9037 / DDB 130130 / EuI1c) TaxID=298654 RepID=E3J571_PSEI1|nr:carboxylic acid reductase [Pseudofrankia inefficax]ADP80669.1 thioester reductase domain protein [Pseudofrankia inefficax]
MAPLSGGPGLGSPGPSGPEPSGPGPSSPGPGSAGPGDPGPGAPGLDARSRRRVAELYATDQQVRDARPLAAVTEALRAPGLSLGRILAIIMAGYADRPALGERARELVVDSETGVRTLRLLPRFDTISYRELWSRAGAIAAEWLHHPGAPLGVGDLVGVLGFTGADYTTIELACVRGGAVSVPLQSGAAASQLVSILAETQPRILAVTVDLLATAVEGALASPSVRRLVVFDDHAEADAHRQACDAARRRLADAARPTESGHPAVLDSLATLVARGARLPAPPVPEAAPDDARLATVIYTSGSTGTPKGAMYPNGLVKLAWRAGFWPRSDDLPVISYNCLPMSHVSARATLAGTLAAGGTSHFAAASDLSTLFEDIALVRPTALRLVPRLCDLLFQRHRGELDRRSAGAGDQAAVDAEVKKELREDLLGGRLAWIGSGSAPLSAEMAAFIESCTQLPAHDGYGSTETGRVLVDGRVSRPPVRDYRLDDVPELGYSRADSPYPRGELLVRTAALIPGYYRRPELTARLVDADGYYRTGDIMAEIGPDELAFVERRAHVLKLAQGEFVAVARLEALFATSPLVHQVFVHGDSERAYLLAVAVPTAAALDRAGEDGPALRSLILESLRRTARDAGLSPHEIPRDVLIETEPFSVENGLLSGVRKPLRPSLERRYGEGLERLYAELTEREADELGALRRAGRDQPVLDAVTRAAQALLGRVNGEAHPEAHFLDLGGDSLSALSFATLLAEIFAVDVPVGVITSPAHDLRKVASHLETALRSGPSGPTFATVHGADATRVRATDLALDRFLDDRTLGAPARSSGPARVVLLTGATGYLGRFLCLEWLERLAPTGGLLICVVRAADPGAARARLAGAFDSGDPDLVARFQRLAARHLEVVAGDVSEPGLGLDEATWRRLAETVDLIVHSAALVNHLLPYEQLFGPNVVATAGLIRLALTARTKRFTYVSTIGVVAAQSAARAEDADIRLASPVRALDGRYASGYTASKWAGEVLLRAAHERYGLPVAVLRPDLILAHSRYAGQLNLSDVVTRLLFSLAATGLAPRTFEAADAGRARARVGGLPVDVTAAAVATLGAWPDQGYQTFNVLQPSGDGPSLDTLVDGLVEAGCRLTRIEDYAQWLARFATAVRALPERRRRYSLLPLLTAFGQPGDPVGRLGFPTDHFATGPVPADRFLAAASRAGLGAAVATPGISAALLRKYVSDLRGLDLL